MLRGWKLSTGLQTVKVVIEHDWYLQYSNEQRSRILNEISAEASNAQIKEIFAAKNWFDNERFKADLEKLKKYRFLKLENMWNFETGNLDKTVKLDLGNDPSVILVYGSYLQEEKLTGVTDLVVYIGSSKRIFDHHKRLIRQTESEAKKPSLYSNQKDFVERIWTLDYTYFDLGKYAADISFELPEKEIS